MQANVIATANMPVGTQPKVTSSMQVEGNAISDTSSSFLDRHCALAICSEGPTPSRTKNKIQFQKLLPSLVNHPGSLNLALGSN